MTLTEPFIHQFFDGAVLYLRSFRKDNTRRHLTYGLILNAAKGLMEVLINLHNANEVSFEIIDQELVVWAVGC